MIGKTATNPPSRAFPGHLTSAFLAVLLGMQRIFSNLRLGRHACAIAALAFTPVCDAGEYRNYDLAARATERTAVETNRDAERHRRAVPRSREKTLYLDYRKTKMTLHYIGVHEVWVSEHCLGRKCLALAQPAVQRGPNETPDDPPWANNPAGDFCKQNGGEYLVAEHPNGNQDELCRFGDGSVIMGWDYYYKFYKRQQ